MMRHQASGYRHLGSDLPLNPPDSYWGADEEPVTCVECGETIADTDVVPTVTERVMNDLCGLASAHRWHQGCVNECLDSHPRGATVRANLA